MLADPVRGWPANVSVTFGCSAKLIGQPVRDQCISFPGMVVDGVLAVRPRLQPSAGRCVCEALGVTEPDDAIRAPVQRQDRTGDRLARWTELQFSKDCFKGLIIP